MELGATRHASTRHHTVDLILGNQILGTYRRNPDQVPIDWTSQDDPPPF